jgi:hypothetical protein
MTTGEVRVGEGDCWNVVVWERFDRVRDVGCGVLLVGFALLRLLLAVVEGFCDLLLVGFAFAFFVGRESIS